MNHFGKGLRKDKFHCALNIIVMLMPLLMAEHSSINRLKNAERPFWGQGSSEGMPSFAFICESFIDLGRVRRAGRALLLLYLAPRRLW